MNCNENTLLSCASAWRAHISTEGETTLKHRGIAASTKILLLMLAIIAFIALPQTALADANHEFFSTCTSQPCIEDEDRSEVTETIHNAAGTPVCRRVVGCDGTVTVTSGKVPDGYTATPGCGNVAFVSIWDLVDSIRLLDPTLIPAEALSLIVPTEITDTTVQDIWDTTISRPAKNYRFDFSNVFDFDPTDSLASTQIIDYDNVVEVSSDKTVNVKMVDLSTGTVLYDDTLHGDYNISTAALSAGCKYSIIMEQEIDRRVVTLRTHNFC
ncbi:MAG: hypothetical protein LBO69_05435, partial [Ignavibacteria bacterium]|nr:hypothetical protein [Ignavibacteria bacterium]